MKASRDELAVDDSSDRYEGRYVAWGGLTVGWEKFPTDLDAAPLLEGKPGGVCQTPHWGLVLAGEILVRYADREETIRAGDAYYIEPGHVPVYAAGTDVFEISPSEGLDALLDHIRAKERGE